MILGVLTMLVLVGAWCRTPIHGILGLTALLLESELTVDQKESLVSTKECADLLLLIINSVLDLAKIEAGRLEVETVPFNIRKMVSSTFRMMQVRAQERGLKLVWDVDRAVPTSLAGDSGKLQQCLLNLGMHSHLLLSSFYKYLIKLFHLKGRAPNLNCTNTVCLIMTREFSPLSSKICVESCRYQAACSKLEP